MIMKTKHVKNTVHKWSGGGKFENNQGGKGANCQGGQTWQIARVGANGAKIAQGGIAPLAL